MKTLHHLLAIATIVTQSATPTYGAPDIVQGPVSYAAGFINGEQFLQLTDSEKSAYAMGLVDGYLSTPLFGGDGKYVQWIRECMRNKTNTQSAAILSTYLEVKPGRWEKRTQALMFEALLQACK